MRHQLFSLLLLLAGVFAAALGLKGFLLPNGFIDGGVTGISLLLARLTRLPLAALIVLINAPFVLLAYFQMDKALALKSFFAILVLALALLCSPSRFPF